MTAAFHLNPQHRGFVSGFCEGLVGHCTETHPLVLTVLAVAEHPGARILLPDLQVQTGRNSGQAILLDGGDLGSGECAA